MGSPPGAKVGSGVDCIGRSTVNSPICARKRAEASAFLTCCPVVGGSSPAVGQSASGGDGVGSSGVWEGGPETGGGGGAGAAVVAVAAELPRFTRSLPLLSIRANDGIVASKSIEKISGVMPDCLNAGKACIVSMSPGISSSVIASLPPRWTARPFESSARGQSSRTFARPFWHICALSKWGRQTAAARHRAGWVQ